MRTGNWQSQPAFLTSRRGKAHAGHETRITAFTHQGRVFLANQVSEGSFGSPWVRKSLTSEKPPPGPPRPPPSHCLSAQNFPGFPELRGGGGCPGASVQAPKSHKSVQNPVSPRKMHEAQRSPQLPSPSGLLPLRRTQNEPMLRKGNVLYCVDRMTRPRQPE